MPRLLFHCGVVKEQVSFLIDQGNGRLTHSDTIKQGRFALVVQRWRKSGADLGRCGLSLPDDLSNVLRRLTSPIYGTRKTAEARAKLANDPLTREYLEAGMRLVIKALQGETKPKTYDQDEPPLFFKWLSRQMVINEVAEGGNQKGNFATSRDRWKYQSYFVDDLLAYILRTRHWFEHEEAAARAKQSLDKDISFGQAVNAAAYDDICALINNRAYRVGLIAAALAESDSSAKAALGETYKWSGRQWSSAYRLMLERLDVKLRPDVSVEELTYMLAATSEGIMLRYISDGNVTVVDHEKRLTLLGKAAMAILMGCVDWSSDGKRLEDLIDSTVGTLGD